MKSILKAMVPILLSFTSGASAFAAHSLPVSVKEGDRVFQGSISIPDSPKGALPLVVVVHEWWGKTEYPEMRAMQIADDLGYAALVVDLYGEGKTAQNPKDAQALATPFYQDPSLGVNRIRKFIAAATETAKQGGASIDTSKIAAIGYCFGGTQVLNLARAGALPDNGKLIGVVSFHGGLASSLRAQGPIEPKLLVLHGAADKMVKQEEVSAFKDEMKKAKADLVFKAYPGALHAFTNPKATEIGKKFQIPVAYDEKADKDSWVQMKSFLKKNFGK